MSDCSRALVLMPDYVDDNVTAAQSGWIRLHLESCAECRDALALIVETDGELVAWGKSVEGANLPPVEARDQLAARISALTSRKFDSLPARHRRDRWIPVAAAVLAAAVALVVIVPHRAPSAANREGNRAVSSFVGIPYLPPLDPRENATIVRMDIQVATLIAAGYNVAAEPDAIVPTDVLVGEDGRARAVRVLSDIELKGRGD
jgi:hypothetical protein